MEDSGRALFNWLTTHHNQSIVYSGNSIACHVTLLFQVAIIVAIVSV